MDISFGRDKVSPPKFPKEFMGRLIVSLRGFYRRLERTQMNGLPIYMNSRQELFRSPVVCVCANAPESSFTIRMDSLVSDVLGMKDFSEIFFSTIKSVAIDMVNVFNGTPQNKTVETDPRSPLQSALRDMSHSIESSSELTRAPLEAANHVGVLVVNYCRLALGEWDYNHSLIVTHSGAQ